MCAEERKEEKKEKGGCAEFGCKPEDFEAMFRKMSACCPGAAGAPDVTAMMKAMKEGCCTPAAKTEAGKEEEPASCA